MKKNELVDEWDFSFLTKTFRIMRITLFLILAVILQTFANEAYSQKTKLSLEYTNTRLEVVLDDIENLTEFFFLANEKLVDIERRVNLSVKDKKIDEILDILFAGTDVVYTITDRKIILAPSFLSQGQQQRTVSGTVTDESGQPLPGVTVVVKGTTQGTVTNAEGEYSLTNIPEDATLVFSFVGMRTQEIPVAEKTRINVVLAEATIGIEEVVAVGYGTQKKVNLTGAVAYVTAETLENRPITSAAQGLQGVIPNLNITISNGDPTNTSADFNIRGFESINGGSPLILVDGVAMDISLINPNDIESVTVLKDASASAIYGARAAFGVVLVNTKKGKGERKASFQYNFEYSLSKPIENYDFVDNLWDYVYYKNLAGINDINKPVFTDDYMNAVKAYYEDPDNNPDWAVVNNTFENYAYIDWKDILLREVAPVQRHNLNVSGGTAKSRYFISGGYIAKEGLIKVGVGDKLERINLMLKQDFEATDWLKFSYKVAFNNEKTKKPHVYKADSYSINALVFSEPINRSIFPASGDYPELEGYYFRRSPEGYLSHGKTANDRNDIWLTGSTDINVTKDLRIIGDFTYNLLSSKREDIAPAFYMIDEKFIGTKGVLTHDVSYPDYIQNDNTFNKYYALNTYAEFEKTFTGGHYLKALAGYNQEWKTFSINRTKAYNLISPSATTVNLTNGDVEITSSSFSEWAIRGAFYRLNYIYDDRYLVEMSGRYDGTSRFPKKDRFGFFPSFSAGWRISEENFMSAAKHYLDNLKVRASYGTLGNQLLGNNYYPYIANLNFVTLNRWLPDGTERLRGMQPAGLISPSLTWESVTTKNIGIDMTLFRQRFDFSFDTYIRATRDMLMQMEYPDILGTSAPRENAADLETKGWELAIGWHDRIGQDFKYDLKFTLADWSSEITKYENPTGALSEYYVGKKIGELWGFETVGLFQSEDEVAQAADQSQISSAGWAPGDVRYKDQFTIDSDGDGIPDAGDGKITSGSQTLDDPGDRVVIGNTAPRYSFGTSLNTSYKDLYLGIFFQGIGKQDFWPGTHSSKFWPVNSNSNIMKHHIEESWTEDNREAYFPRLVGNSKNQQPQTRYLQDASYIRLKNLTFGYNLPSNWLNRAGIDQARIYFSGENLWYATKMHKPLSPEETPEALTIDYNPVASQGVVYPYQSTYSFGINITF